MNSEQETFLELVEYQPPPWCKALKVVPKYRIPLAMKPTPIHPWNVDGIPEDFHLFVKRDDMTGCLLSGNKARKLEFLLADAKVKGCTDVITTGITQSNHARATLIASRLLGLDCHLVLLDKEQNSRSSSSSGNFLLMETLEPDVYLLPWKPPFPMLNAEKAAVVLANHINGKPGRSAYVVPPGGSDAIGVHGYISAWDEMMKQGIQDRFDDVVCASGSGGTILGLAVGNYLTGNKLRVHGVSVGAPEELFYSRLNEKLSMIGLDEIHSRDIVSFIDGRKLAGYAEFTKADIDYYQNVAKTTGLFCDPVYVGKGLKAFVNELNTNPGHFKGNRILFIHTGGLFALMQNSAAVMMRSEDAIEKIVDWEEMFVDENEMASRD